MKIFILLAVTIFVVQSIHAQDTLSVDLYKNKRHIQTKDIQEAKYSAYKILNKNNTVTYINYSLISNEILNKRTYDFGIKYYDKENNVFDEIKMDSLLQEENFIKADYVGGQEALWSFLSNIDYPQIAIDNDIEGRVFVQFIVEKDGSLNNFVVRSGGHPLLEQAVISVFKRLPKFIPATLNGKAVRTTQLIPYSFKIG